MGSPSVLVVQGCPSYQHAWLPPQDKLSQTSCSISSWADTRVGKLEIVGVTAIWGKGWKFPCTTELTSSLGF